MVVGHTECIVLARFTCEFMEKIIINSLGRWSTATKFVPLFPEQKPRHFVETKYEAKEAKTQELPGSALPETQSRLAQEDQQAVASKT